MRKHPALIVAALALLLPSCGHRGNPLPPRRKTPPPPQDFRLAQRGDTLEVRATAPDASVDGIAYEALEMEFLYTDGLKDIEKAGARRRVRAAPGSRVAIALPLPAPGTLLRAAARAVVGREQGPRTLTLTLPAQAPIEAPRELAAALTEAGVSLSWRGPQPKAAAPPALEAKLPGKSATPAPPPAVPGPASPQAPGPPAPAAETGAAPAAPRRSGFLVYRRLGEAPFGEPLGGEPLERRTLEDTTIPTGVTACYEVRAAASVDPLVESAPSNEACVEMRDIAAPPAPAGLAVLPRENGLELLWSPSGATDLAGYRVYRAAPEGRPARIAEVGADHPSWLDETAARGAVYRYTVTAFDQTGNESEAGEPVEASLP